jgi:malonate decarboxylase epsilon subunit
VRSASAVATDLTDNIAHGVRWHDATIVAEELSCNLLLEIPPGHTLTDLAEENVRGVTASVVTTDLFRHVLRLATA